MVTAIKGEKKLKSAGLQPEKRKKIQRQKDLFQADTYSIWAAMILLVAFGLMMIYSASGYRFAGSSAHGYDSMYLLKRQIIFAGAGVAACFFGQYLNYRLLNKKIFAVAIYIVGIASILLLKTSLGVSANGATRWLNIAGIQFQVAEIVKICVIVMLAYLLQKHLKRMNTGELIIRAWLTGGLAAILLLTISNDLSSSLVVLGITYGITFVYTRTEKLHYTLAGGAIATVVTYIWYLKNHMPSEFELEKMSFRVGRIAAWIDPERYANNQGYQTLQALYAIGSGGIWGKGLGSSTQKLSAIPEAQNDMIFSIICEELGLAGALILVVLIVFLCYELFKIAISAQDLFGSVLATGVLIHMGFQSFVNIGVNVNLLPNTGIGLPFISYGGTAVFCQLAEIAIVLSIGRAALGFEFLGSKKKVRRRDEK